MSLPDFRSGDVRASFIARIRGILLTPDKEWAVIDAEPATVPSLFQGYILILAAIGPIATFLHGVLFGYGALGFSYHPSFFSSLVGAVVSYGLALVGAYVVALVIDFLTPNFGGQKNPVQALKVVAYGSTAAWLAGSFGLIPGLGVLGLLGLYSLFLYYKGLPLLMRVPAEKALPFTAAIVVSAFVVHLVIAGLSASLGATWTTVASIDHDEQGSGTVSLPGGGSFDLGKLQEAAKALEQASKPGGSGAAHPPVPTDALKTLVPDTLPGGFARQTVSTASGQIAGLGGSAVEASFGTGNRTIKLSLVDMGVAGAIASLGGVLGINGSEESATHSSKMTQVDGRTVIEDYDRSSKSGDYAVIGASRFMVKAEGTGVTLEELQRSVRAVDINRLEALGH
jgi:hypothetical protein